ncbi:bifunctional protein-serine/threonine kinase/phosphatase [Aquabacterium sp.]|uniref:bifunctional protein-serine/threonine kinase/phosphatase n=1 Tax=Aquabacterium sp. TaxID=1872578 RepID=UPI002C3541F4|nr:bifunctional protein-serine/threonine kinase/phosphatase [Aquabacterium sp.]HSW03236.1 bifunctional protein-serine/threonine kinase/phosphatase [Aquabacterium sp.]
MSFHVDIGRCSERGQREFNEDFTAALQAPAHEAGRGLIAAVADGVSAGGHGRAAAQTAVISLVNDFHAVPATWETTVALDRLIGAHNAWLADHNKRRSDDASGLTTLTALALQGQTWTVAHVGDTRAWLLRDGELLCLTQDHALDHPDLRSQLTRALGLEDTVRVDFHQGALQIGDVLLLSSDGVHGALKPAALSKLLGATGPAQGVSEAIVQAALAAGSRDNVTALVIQVQGLASQRLDDALLQGRQLPAAPRWKVGDGIDGYTITALVADTGVHRLYQARENATRELVAIKTLHESRAGDAEERGMLAHEAWLGQTVTERQAQGFVRVRPQRAPTAFYVVFDWHSGATLEQQLADDKRFVVDEVVQGAIAMARALGRLHRQRVIHRDVKPANLHLADDGQWRLLDLGVAVSGNEPGSVRSLHAGTPSFMNPEQWEEGGQADAMSDLYALGVTLYRWLTGRLPYGEIEPYQTARYRRDPVPPSRIRPEVPIWLDHVVLKAVARDRRQRFETAEELLLALERGASRPLAAPPATPLVNRDPAAMWKIALALSVGLNVLLIVWLLFLPR